MIFLCYVVVNKIYLNNPIKPASYLAGFFLFRIFINNIYLCSIQLLKTISIMNNMDWVMEDNSLSKDFEFSNSSKAMKFVDDVDSELNNHITYILVEQF